MELITIPLTRRDRRPFGAWKHIETMEDSRKAWEEADRSWSGPKATGLLTGPSGLLVVDLDVGHEDGANGVKSLEAHLGGRDRLKEWIGGAGVVCQTRRGGLHIYWKRPLGIGGTTQGVLPGVDARGVGGLVVCPPSEGYRWLKADWDALSEPPEWLVSLLEPRTGTTTPDGCLKADTGKVRVNCPICEEPRAAVIWLPEPGRVQGRGWCSACQRSWRSSSKQIQWAMENQVR